MRSPRCHWRLIVIFVLASILVAACGGSEKDDQQAAAHASETVSPRVALDWQQASAADLKVLSANTFRTGAGEYMYLVGAV